MGFDRDGKPDYETWLKMKEREEGNRSTQPLEKLIEKTVDNMYEEVYPIDSTRNRFR